MSTDHDGEHLPSSYDGSAVVLPCTPDQFAQFIGDLLGKPQVIQRSFSGSIDIGHSDVVSLYHLINHRLVEQNRAQIIQFSVTLSYNDQSSVTINGAEEFEKFAEIKSVETLSLTCSFEYLIRFSGRSHPERQTVDVTFNRSGGAVSLEDDDLPSLRHRAYGTVVFRIKHTARSWGADIESLLAEHIKGLIKSDGIFPTFIRRHSTAFGFPFGLVTLAGGVLALGSVSNYMNSGKNAEALAALAKIHDSSSASSLGIPVLIHLHLQLNAMAPWLQITWVVILLVSMVFAIMVWLFMGEQLSKTIPSLLTFTRADQARRPKVLAAYNRSAWYALGAALGSVFYGVLGNYLSYLLAQLWSAR